MVDTKNEFAVARTPTLTDDSKLQVTVKHDFSETFERDKLDGKTVGKGEFHNLVTSLCKIQYHNLFGFIIYFHLFYTYGKATDQTCANISLSPEFIQDKMFKPTPHPVEFVDAIFPVYKQKEGGHQKTPSHLSTEYLPKQSNEEAIDLGMGDTCYPNSVPLMMYDFGRNLYLNNLNSLNPSLRIKTKLKSSSVDPVK